jgi:DNA-binding MarR family transcriptional regulator
MANTTRVEEVADLGFQLAHTSYVLTTELTAALGGLGITQRSYCVLKAALTGDHTQIRLADMCQLDKTTMVVTVDELEKAGLVERQPSPADRRARLIAVTDKGAKVSGEAEKIVDGVYRDVLGTLPDDVRDGFVRGLTHLAEGRLSTPVQCRNAPRRRM